LAASQTITGCSPGKARVGDSVTVTGTGFLGATSVTFNGTPDPTFTVIGGKKISATVPDGASTGPISVTTPSGTATSARSFTVLPDPAIVPDPIYTPPGSH